MEEIKALVKEIIAEMKTVGISCVIKKSDEINEIATALSKFQGEVLNPDKSANNPFFKSKYAPLDSLLNEARPKLSKYGLAILQSSSCTDDKATVTTLVTHSSGQWIEAEPLTLKATKSDAQGIGSAITYARRYTLSAILGVVGEEDDDGNSAVGKTNVDGKQEQSKNIGNKKTSGSTDKTTSELKTLKAEVVSLAKEKSAQSDEVKEVIKSILSNYHPSGNPNKLDDIDKVKELLEELKNIK